MITQKVIYPQRKISPCYYYYRITRLNIWKKKHTLIKKSLKIMFNTQTVEVWKVKIDVRGSFWLKHTSVGREKKKLIKMNLCKTYIYLATKISKNTEFCYQFYVSWLSYMWKIKQLPNLYNCAQPPTSQWSIRRSDQIAHLVMLSGHRVKYLSIKKRTSVCVKSQLNIWLSVLEAVLQRRIGRKSKQAGAQLSLNEANYDRDRV